MNTLEEYYTVNNNGILEIDGNNKENYLNLLRSINIEILIQEMDEYENKIMLLVKNNNYLDLFGFLFIDFNKEKDIINIEKCKTYKDLNFLVKMIANKIIYGNKERIVSYINNEINNNQQFSEYYYAFLNKLNKYFDELNKEEKEEIFSMSPIEYVYPDSKYGKWSDYIPLIESIGTKILLKVEDFNNIEIALLLKNIHNNKYGVLYIDSLLNSNSLINCNNYTDLENLRNKLSKHIIYENSNSSFKINKESFIDKFYNKMDKSIYIPFINRVDLFFNNEQSITKIIEKSKIINLNLNEYDKEWYCPKNILNFMGFNIILSEINIINEKLKSILLLQHKETKLYAYLELGMHNYHKKIETKEDVNIYKNNIFYEMVFGMHNQIKNYINKDSIFINHYNGKYIRLYDTFKNRVAQIL